MADRSLASARSGTFRIARSLRLLGLVGGLAAGLGCSLTSRPTPEPLVESALRSFADDDPDEAAALDFERALQEDPASVEATTLALLDDPHPDVRLMAIYGLAETANSPAGLRALRRLLDAADPSERALAAEALLRRGESGAIPVLIELLSLDAPLRLSEPPQPIWEFARTLLLLYTEQDLGLATAPDAASAASAKTSWESWWAASGPDVIWDEAQLQFREGP